MQALVYRLVQAHLPSSENELSLIFVFPVWVVPSYASIVRFL